MQLVNGCRLDVEAHQTVGAGLMTQLSTLNAADRQGSPSLATVNVHKYGVTQGWCSVDLDRGPNGIETRGAKWNCWMGLRWCGVGGLIGGAEGIIGGSVKVNGACCREPLVQDHVRGPSGSHFCYGILNLRV